MENLIINSADDLENFAEEFIEQGRRGIIDLAAPVLNINEWSATKPSYYALLLGMTSQQFEKIAYYADCVVSESALEGYRAGQILSGEALSDYERLSEKEKSKIKILQGAEAVEYLVSRIDLNAKRREARETEISCMRALESLWDRYDELGGAGILHDYESRMLDAKPDENGNGNFDMTEQEKAVCDINAEIQKNRTLLAESRSKLTAIARIEEKGLKDLIVKEIVLFPVDLKRIMKHAYKEMPYAVYDIELQYIRIANRNERVKKLIALDAPDIILRNEKRMLQEYVDSLINNGIHGKPYVINGSNEGCPAVSLTDILLRNTHLV